MLWSRFFDWKEALAVVTPATFVRWHRRSFKLYWGWKSRGGRPPLPKEIRQLIARLVRENLTWGEERVADELSLKLGIYVSPRTVRQVLAEAAGPGWAYPNLVAALENVRQESCPRNRCL